MAKKDPEVVRPHWLWFLVLDGGILMLIQIVLSRAPYEKVRERTADRLPSYQVVQGLLAGTAVIHVGEAMLAARMAGTRGLRRRGWALQTFAVGFPSLLELRKV
ncbi:MAG TPA: DUF4499 domain-containing protein [Acidimicrobiales bacterium]|jgi:hypothetical protein